MSLIHQALKKLEGGLALSSVKGAPDYADADRRGSEAWPRIIVLSVVLAFTAAVFVLSVKAGGGAASTGVFGRSYGRMRAEKPDAPMQVTPEELTPARIDAALERNRYGLALYARGFYRDAAAEFDGALKAGASAASERSVFYNNLGQALAALDDSRGAEDAFKNALSFNSGYPEALNNYGALLLRRKKFERSIAMFNRALLQAPDYAAPYLNRGAALEMLGRYDAALLDYERFIVLNAALDAQKRSANTQEVESKIKRLASGLYRGYYGR